MKLKSQSICTLLPWLSLTHSIQFSFMMRVQIENWGNVKKIKEKGWFCMWTFCCMAWRWWHSWQWRTSGGGNVCNNRWRQHEEDQNEDLEGLKTKILEPWVRVMFKTTTFVAVTFAAKVYFCDYEGRQSARIEGSGRKLGMCWGNWRKGATLGLGGWGKWWMAWLWRSTLIWLLKEEEERK